jgi:hypothetical protein
MKREASIFAALVFMAASLPLAFAQNRQGQPGPVLPSDILGPQLIAWSQLQKPQPIPQPVPQPLLPPERPVPYPVQHSDPQPDQQPPQAVNPPAQQPPAAQTFTGTIVADGVRYVLKVSSNSVYQLDDQERARRYEGKQVKIVGTLNATGNSLHITSIELVS